MLERFNQRITKILGEPAPIDQNGALNPQKLTLTPQAKSAWIRYHDAIEGELSSSGELFDVRDVASKSADNAARLAALFHIFEGGQGAISEDAFERASQITLWHLSESRRFFGELALPVEVADAFRLEKWLIDCLKKEKSSHTGKRHIQQSGPVRDGARLNSAIKELVALDRIRERKDGKKAFIDINPALLAQMS